MVSSPPAEMPQWSLPSWSLPSWLVPSWVPADGLSLVGPPLCSVQLWPGPLGGYTHAWAHACNAQLPWSTCYMHRFAGTLVTGSGGWQLVAGPLVGYPTRHSCRIHSGLPHTTRPWLRSPHILLVHVAAHQSYPSFIHSILRANNPIQPKCSHPAPHLPTPGHHDSTTQHAAANSCMPTCTKPPMKAVHGSVGPVG